MILVSACLAGIDCRWDGENRLDPEIKELVDKKEAIALCPEVLGIGAPGVPRESVELVGGDGNDVLDGKARAISSSGRDVTENFILGSSKILKILKAYDIKEAILKSNSPTCGVDHIYDGTFSGTLKDGDGVLTALLKRNNIKVRTETTAL